MAGKISEMSAASALDGSEQLEVVQSGANKKVTINDLLPVQLQGDKTIGLDGHRLEFLSGGSNFFVFNPTPGNEDATIQVFDNTDDGNKTYISALATTTQAYFDLKSVFNDGVKLVQIYATADNSASSISYTADNHIFQDVIAKDFADDTAAATGLVPVGGLYHTSGVLKIRLS